jgi:hypothetical protein
MGKCQTFLSKPEPSPGGELKRHLNIVISDPDSENNYLVVPVTTYHENIKDPRNEQNCNTCFLDESSHHFLDHESWVKFSKARQMGFAEIFNGIKKGDLLSRKDISEEVLKHIQAHAKTSDFLPDKLRSFEDYF